MWVNGMLFQVLLGILFTFHLQYLGRHAQAYLAVAFEKT